MECNGPAAIQHRYKEKPYVDRSTGGGRSAIVCALGNENGTILEQVSIPTTTPERRWSRIRRYFKEQGHEALGVAAFGPVDVKPQSPTYGRILDTPKLAWRHFDFLGALKKELDVPMGLDTDVNGSCLGEMTYGCAQGLDSAIYITIGTGVGVRASTRAENCCTVCCTPREAIPVARHPEDPEGGMLPIIPTVWNCPADRPSSDAGAKRLWAGRQPDHFGTESYYIAQGLVNYIMILSPQKIILGGGVMHQEQLFPMIREKVAGDDRRLLQRPLSWRIWTTILCRPASTTIRGIMGCIKLGLDALC